MLYYKSETGRSAALNRKAVVIDGFISIVAALTAYRMCPAVKDYMFASHASFEIGFARAAKELGIAAPFMLDMRLGEGSGCLEKGKLFKNKYKPVEEKKAALVAACAKLKAAEGTVQMVEVAETDKHGVEDTVVYRVMLKDGKWLSAEGLSGTPFKMRGLTSPDVPVGMKALILLYFVLFFGLFGLGTYYYM